MKINIAKSKDRNTTIGLDKIHFKEFFKQLWQKEQKALGIDKGMEFHFLLREREKLDFVSFPRLPLGH